MGGLGSFGGSVDVGWLMDDLGGAIAVVTGGAAGIGRGIVEALLEEGARVVIADIEEPVLDRAVDELARAGSVRGVVTDVADPVSVQDLADLVFSEYGACHVLWNNAGVTSGGGGNPWEQEPNDWTWCFGVNVFGTANGIMAFVPRMLAGGQPGAVVTTSSGDGGIAPVPYASVYASSKAAISCLTEALAHQFVAQGSNLRAAVFYPSGGLLETGLWEAQRNRPPHLARTRPRPPAPGTTFAEFKATLAAAGRPTDVVDLLELGRFAVRGVKEGRFVIGHDLERAGRLLHARADAVAKGMLPPSALEGLT
ncbi:MAG TPA: SDR family NAD(P)-dependent oxidoreductase [Acidimicrobiales bacterium]|nr:SDR family NAD(P)-dependent oxidoreductase [Acidimicrobiales bacterium]